MKRLSLAHLQQYADPETFRVGEENEQSGHANRNDDRSTRMWILGLEETIDG